jgi:hypothetical protein
MAPQRLLGLAGGDVPHDHRTVVAHAGHPGAVRAKRELQVLPGDSRAVAGDDPAAPAGRGVGQHDRPVLLTQRHRAAVGAQGEGGSADWDHADWTTAGDVPDDCLVVLGRRNQSCPAGSLQFRSRWAHEALTTENMSSWAHARTPYAHAFMQFRADQAKVMCLQAAELRGASAKLIPDPGLG